MSEAILQMVRLRSGEFGTWIVLYMGILAAWTGLFFMATQSDLAALNATGMSLWDALCAAGAEGRFPAVLAMWIIMAAAMMLPTAVPAFLTYSDLSQSGAGRVWPVIAGYLLVWIGFAVLAAGVQVFLAGLGYLDATGRSLNLWLTAGLLGLAGAWQLTNLKDACLSKCRQPLTFFMQYWKPGNRAGVLMGLRLGAICLVCCWALMALAFVGGLMSLIWMGLATVLMTLEKLPRFGAVLTRPLGFALLGGSVAALLAAL